MYFYIKETVNKLKTKGYSKELLTGTRTLDNGIVINTHEYSKDCFIRNPKSSYTIFLCRSYKENGKAKTKQYNICTISYWDIAESYADEQLEFDDLEKALWFKIYDSFIPILKEIAEEKGMNEDEADNFIEDVTGDFYDKTAFFDDIIKVWS